MDDVRKFNLHCGVGLVFAALALAIFGGWTGFAIGSFLLVSGCWLLKQSA